MAVQYQWYNNMVKDLDAQTTGEYLESLVEKFNNHLTLEEIVADARKNTSPLHKGFTWDDSLAAEKQRRREARGIMTALLIKRPKPKDAKKKPRVTTAFVFVHVPGQTRKAYIPLRQAMQDHDMHTEVRERKLKEMQRRFAQYAGDRDLKFLAPLMERMAKKIDIELMTASGVFR